MKKLIYTLLFTVGLLAMSCAQKDKVTGNVIIQGKVDGFKQGKLYLQQLQDTTLVVIDSVQIGGDSNFSFGLNLDSPEILILAIDRGHSTNQDNQIMFFAEPGNITINTSLKKFYADADITGSKTQEVYRNYLKTRNAILDKQNEMLVEIFTAEKDNELQKRDSLLKQADRLTIRKYLNAVNFALNHKNTDVAPYIALSDLYDAQTKYLDTIYKALSPEVVNNKYGKQLQAYIAERKNIDQEIAQ